MVSTEAAGLHAVRQQVRTATWLRKQADQLLEREPALVSLNGVLGANAASLPRDP